MSGPIPKHSSERTRRNKETESGASNEVTKGQATPVSWPPAKKEWDEFTRGWYNGLKKSGMAAYYQQSDVAMALMLANEMYLYQQSPPGRRSSMMFAALMSAMTGLGVTEGERRRMRIELEAPKTPEKTAGVTTLENYKKGLKGGK